MFQRMNRVVRSFLIVIALLNLTFFFRWWKKDDLCIIEEIEGSDDKGRDVLLRHRTEENMATQTPNFNTKVPLFIVDEHHEGKKCKMCAL